MPIKQDNGREAQDERETIKRWEEWTKTWAHTLDTIPKMQHIHPSYWSGLNGNEDDENNGIPHETVEIRKHSYLQAFFRQYPNCQNVLEQSITSKEVSICINTLAKNKSHGADGIPAEVYIACDKMVCGNIALICNNIGKGGKCLTNGGKGWLFTFTKIKGTPRTAIILDPFA